MNIQSFRGAWLPGIILLFTALLLLLTFFIYGGGEETIRLYIRNTARTTAVCFLLAFVATPLARRFPSGLTGWLDQNQAWLVLSMLASHIAHFVGLVWVDMVGTEHPLTGGDLKAYVAGGSGYLLLFVLAYFAWRSLSSPLSMGVRRFQAAAMYVIAVIFVIAFGGHLQSSPLYVVFVLLTLAALGIRAYSDITSKAGDRSPA